MMNCYSPTGSMHSFMKWRHVRCCSAGFALPSRGHSLVGEAWGELVDVAKHQPAVEVKGATYTELHVRKGSGGTWVAQCVVDV